jgi:C-3',4' desaturase CrtD
VGDLLRAHGLGHDRRLKAFLDLQLKLYSQVEADATATLYGATALGVSQAPQGLYHLHGSMQVLSDRLLSALTRDGGQLYLRHTVEDLQVKGKRVRGVMVRNQVTGQVWTEPVEHVVANLTVQNLIQLLGEAVPTSYQRRVDKLSEASGAFVVYLGVDAAAIPDSCPPHLQFLYSYEGPIAENNSLFVSVSRPGDGRAPAGQATIIASTFTEPRIWLQTVDYDGLKRQYMETAIAHLGQFFNLEGTLIHQEAATPRTFQRYTARAQGIVGGVSQSLATFGPLGFANRTPIQGLWLVGDSTHPGEGTAGVSYSALTAVRQIEASSLY